MTLNPTVRKSMSIQELVDTVARLVEKGDPATRKMVHDHIKRLARNDHWQEADQALFSRGIAGYSGLGNELTYRRMT
jgi:hypothetical protein